MGWQDDIREILEKSDWPPTPGAIVKVPWLRVVLLAVAGWVVADILTRAAEGARSRPRRTVSYR
jgi:hypothetical protein